MSPQARNSNEPNFLNTWISIKKTAFFFSPEEFRHTKDATTPLEDSYLITLGNLFTLQIFFVGFFFFD